MTFPGRTDTSVFQCPVCFNVTRKKAGPMAKHDRTSWTGAKKGGTKRKAVFCLGSGMEAVERKW